MKELLDIAILAYRSRKYDDAIEILTQIVDGDKQNWLAWFYLGMSYLECGDSDHAYKIMRVIAALCPTEQLRATAAAVLPSNSDVTKVVPQQDEREWKLATG